MSKEISLRLQKATSLLESGRLNASIAAASEAAGILKANAELSRLRSLEDSYAAMRRYFLEGGPDDSMSAMLADMEERMRAIIDSLRRRQMAVDASGSYYECMRREASKPSILAELLNRNEDVAVRIELAKAAGTVPSDLMHDRYQLLDRIFSRVLISYHDDDAATSIGRLLNDPNSDLALIVQVVTAMSLGLTAWYDAAAVKQLIGAAANPAMPDAVKARAAVGILFALLLWPEETARSKEIKEMLAALADSSDWTRRLRTVVKAICSTRDTERVARKMQEEVIPEIMKLRPEIVDKMKNFNPEEGGIENNPEWQDMLDKSGITRKLEELNEMMNDGADMMMVTFSQLKRFTFFDRPGNWFLPFDVNHPYLILDDRERKILDSIFSIGGSICDSDKYSLALAMRGMPQAQRSMVLSQFEQQFEQLSEEAKASLPESSRVDFDKEVTRSMRDFYRYFKLARYTDAFRNPFSLPVNPKNLPVVGDAVASDEFLTVLAEFYMKRDLFQEALDIFTLFYDTTDDYMTCQKIGYCRQKTGDFAGAREAYMKAELLGDSSLWLSRRLAYINRRLGRHIDALEYYNRALSADPDNLKLIMNAADTAMHCGRIDEALHHLHHADYLNPDDRHVWRNIAWCELLAGNLDKSSARYDALLLDAPEMGDWLNAGHLAFLRHDYKNARTRYRVARDIDAAAFAEAFKADTTVLNQMGIDRTAINIMLDEVES